MERLLNMIVRQVVRKLVNKGVNAGFDRVAGTQGKRGKPHATGRNVRQAGRVASRMTRM
jgi:hypothetical protein